MTDSVPACAQPLPALGDAQRWGDVCCNLLEVDPVVSYRIMATTGLKQKMVETVEHLPESATVEDAIERLYFLAKVERGLEQSAAGDTIAHEDIKKRFLG